MTSFAFLCPESHALPTVGSDPVAWHAVVKPTYSLSRLQGEVATCSLGTRYKPVDKAALWVKCPPGDLVAGDWRQDMGLITGNSELSALTVGGPWSRRRHCIDIDIIPSPPPSRRPTLQNETHVEEEPEKMCISVSSDPSRLNMTKNGTCQAITNSLDGRPSLPHQQLYARHRHHSHQCHMIT